MKNLLSKIFSRENKVKAIKYDKKSPKVELGQKFDIYIHVLETGKGKNVGKGKFILLDGIKGIFKIEEMYELGHSAQYRLELIRENLPKDYNYAMDKIENYSTNYQEDSFKMMP